MKLFYAILLGLLTLKATCGPNLIVNSEIQQALDNDDEPEVHDTELEGSILLNHDNDFENLKNNEHTEITTERLAPNDESKLRRPFDIDRFLTELDAFDCDKRKAGSSHFGESESEFDSLCANALEESTFKPLGNFDADPDEFYSYIADNIYRPLAYHVEKKDSLSDVLKDLIFIDDRHSLINNDASQESYSDFENNILDEFSKIQGMTSDMDTYHETISNIMVDLLKKFHIYWNTLRSKDQIDKVKVDTKEVMRNILREYEVKEKFLYEVTQTLAAQIKDAYSRFLKAHQSVKLLNIEGPNIIANRILDRYRTVIDAFKSRRYSFIQFVKEIAMLTDLQQAYYVINYKLKFNEPQNIQNFYIHIFNKIQPIYLDFISTITEDDNIRNTIKHFTATLLLKMKQTQHLIFNFHGIAVFVNFNRSVIQTLSPITVKVYYDLLNNLLLVPKVCLNMLVLKQCAFNEVNKALRSVGSKYLLKRSTGGWGIYTYTHDMIKLLFMKSNELVFSNWTIFKSFYYENLFAIMTNLKQRFMIKNIDCVDDLEDKIGETIDKFKKDNGNQNLNFGLIDEFDDDLYKSMLDIKSEYNKYDNINNDPTLLFRIRNDLFNKFKNFEKQFAWEINQDFVALLDHVRDTIEEWRGATIRAPEVSIQVSELPLHSMNLYPQVFHNVIEPKSVDNFDVSDTYKKMVQEKVIANTNKELAESAQSLSQSDLQNSQPRAAMDNVNHNTLSTVDNQVPVTDSRGTANADSLNMPERKLNDDHSQDNLYTSTIVDDKNFVRLTNIDLASVPGAQVSTKEEIVDIPVDRYPIVPQHLFSSDEMRDSKDVSLESGVTEFDLS